MGWTSWNTFFEENSQEKMKSQVDALLELGLDQFGYTFLTIDDFWQLPDRDPDTGMMIADPDRFPDGISHLSDYMHSRGLKIGIYSSAGRYTCSGDTIHLTLTHDEHWCQDSCQDHSATRRLMCRCCLTGRLTTSNMTTAIPGEDQRDNEHDHDDDDDVRLDGETNISGTGTNIDLEMSAEHYPSLWQSPPEIDRSIKINF